MLILHHCVIITIFPKSGFFQVCTPVSSGVFLGWGGKVLEHAVEHWDRNYGHLEPVRWGGGVGEMAEHNTALLHRRKSPASAYQLTNSNLTHRNLGCWVLLNWVLCVLAYHEQPWQLILAMTLQLGFRLIF